MIRDQHPGASPPPFLRRLLVVGLSCALLAAGCGGGGPVDGHALSKEADALRSLAAEGALLAEVSAAGSTTDTYTRQHAAVLHTASLQTADSLKGASAGPGLRPELQELRLLAGRVARELERLGHASQHEQRALAHRLDAAAKQIETISQGLQ
jgi:hypothetical protein